MKKKLVKDSRLARLSGIARALPEALLVMAAQHATFEVHQKVFAYYLNNYQGDGMVGVCCLVPPGENERLVGLHPGRYYLPASRAAEGWAGLRLDVGGVDWDEVASMVLGSYKRVAPARLVVLADSAAARAGAKKAR